MIGDRERVVLLQQHLKEWNLDGECIVHSFSRKTVKNCAYDQQGRLITLYLCKLGLKKVPSEVWLCTALQELFLDVNQLSNLPVEIGQLSSLQKLDLSDNPLQSPPPEVVAQGVPALLAYLRDLK